MLKSLRVTCVFVVRLCLWEARLLKGCGRWTSTCEKCIVSGEIHVIGAWMSSGCSIIVTERLCVVFAATEEIFKVSVPALYHSIFLHSSQQHWSRLWEASYQLQTTRLKEIKAGKRAEVSQQTVWGCRSGNVTAAMTELGPEGGATHKLCSNNHPVCIYEVVKMTDYRMLHFLLIVSSYFNLFFNI